LIIVRWIPEQLSWLGVVDDQSEGDVVTVRIGSPSGILSIMAEVDLVDGRVLILKGTHMQSEGGPGSIGIVNLRIMADFVLERVDCDEAIIEGAIRTSGANPGHRPIPIRFRRRSRAASGA
jgi:hypothetical protein